MAALGGCTTYSTSGCCDGWTTVLKALFSADWTTLTTSACFAFCTPQTTECYFFVDRQTTDGSATMTEGCCANGGTTAYTSRRCMEGATVGSGTNGRAGTSAGGRLNSPSMWMLLGTPLAGCSTTLCSSCGWTSGSGA